MPTVIKGANTASGKPADGATAHAPNASHIISELRKSAAESGVVYEGEWGHGYLRVPKQRYNSNGEFIGADPGFELDMNGAGITKPFFPEKNRADYEYCAELDGMIADKHPSVVQFNIRKREPGCPAAPCQGWNRLATVQLKTVVEANLSESDNDQNIEYVKACARYETFRKDPESGKSAVRDDVLAMLDGLLVSEAALSSAFDAEITLN